MNANYLLSQVTIPTACPAHWNLMQGDDRVRFCESCGKQVYNFAAMSSDELITLIRAKEGKLCGRLFRRHDGTVLTSDCQPEPPPKPKPLQFTLRAMMTVVAGFATVFGLARLLYKELIPPPPDAATEPSTLFTVGVLLRIDVSTGLDEPLPFRPIDVSTGPDEPRPDP